MPFSIDDKSDVALSNVGMQSYLYSEQKKTSGIGIKIQEKDFTIRKKKSRKEVENLLGNSRGQSETSNLTN